MAIAATAIETSRERVQTRAPHHDEGRRRGPQPAVDMADEHAAHDGRRGGEDDDSRNDVRHPERGCTRVGCCGHAPTPEPLAGGRAGALAGCGSQTAHELPPAAEAPRSPAAARPPAGAVTAIGNAHDGVGRRRDHGRRAGWRATRRRRLRARAPARSLRQPHPAADRARAGGPRADPRRLPGSRAVLRGRHAGRRAAGLLRRRRRRAHAALRPARWPVRPRPRPSTPAALRHPPGRATSWSRSSLTAAPTSWRAGPRCASRTRWRWTRARATSSSPGGWTGCSSA